MSTTKHNLKQQNAPYRTWCLIVVMVLWIFSLIGCCETHKKTTCTPVAVAPFSEDNAGTSAPFLETVRPTYELARSVTSSQPPPEAMTFNLPGGVPLEMIGVGAGTFVMGVPTPEDGLLPEEYRHNLYLGHKVTLTKPFWLGRYEITQKQYEAVAGKRKFAVRGDNLPVDNLTWAEARDFTKKLNGLFANELPEGYAFELPSEAQWEYACRAGTVSTYNNGKMGELETRQIANTEVKQVVFRDKSTSLDEVAWYNGNSGDTIHPVGTKKPNAWGFYDMHGNVSEWCLDFFANNYGDESTNIMVATANMIDPLVLFQSVTKTNKWEIGARVMRGGNCQLPPQFVTSYHRDSVAPTSRWNAGGLRVALVSFVAPQVDLADNTIYGVSPSAQEYFRSSRVFRQQWAEQQETFWRQQEERDRKFKREMAFWNTMFTLLEVGRAVGGVALDAHMNRQRINGTHTLAIGTSASSGGVTGFGTIKGPSSLAQGDTASYHLYVGGKKITSGMTWSADGTSITVYDAGAYGRAMAGNPPVRNGSFKSGIKVFYNGKYYRKSISITK